MKKKPEPREPFKSCGNCKYGFVFYQDRSGFSKAQRCSCYRVWLERQQAKEKA